MNVVTLTLNPAVDKSLMVDGLLPNNKLICHSLQHQAGGGGVFSQTHEKNCRDKRGSNGCGFRKI